MNNGMGENNEMDVYFFVYFISLSWIYLINKETDLNCMLKLSFMLNDINLLCLFINSIKAFIKCLIFYKIFILWIKLDF